MSTTETPLARWRGTNRRACDLEAALFDATMAYACGRGPKPPDQLVEEARALRAECKSLFDKAMQELNESQRIAYGCLMANSGQGVH